MKQILLFLLLIAGVIRIGFSQELTWNERLKAINAIDSVLRIYEDNLTFTDVVSDSISAKTMKKFKSIFTEEALIFDDLNPDFFDDPHNKSLHFRSKPIDEFLSKTKEVYPRGLVEAVITNMAISYDDLSQQSALVSVEKRVTGYTFNGWQVLTIDTVLLTMKLSSDFKGVQIERISEDGEVDGKANFQIINDSDGDLVIDEEDNCKDVPGYIIYKGCEPPKGPSQTLLISGGPGYSFDSFAPNAENMNTSLFDNYSIGEYGQSYRLLPDFNLSVEWEYFLGLKRHIGLGIGLMYTRITSNLKVDHYNISFEDIENVDGIGVSNSYKRIISSTDSISENITFNYFALPIVSFIYKTPISSKLGLKINIGIGLSLPTKPGVTLDDNSDFSNSFNYEASYDTVSNSFGYVSTASHPGTAALFTEAFIESIGGDKTAFFQLLQDAGYDLALHKKIEKPTTNDNKFGIGYAVNIRLTFPYLLASGAHFNIGPQIIIEHHENKGFNADDYKLTNTVGEYNTLLAGSPRVNHIYLGLTVGISISLSNKYIDQQAY
ncbi:MAG: hypothetical protein IPO83_18130 [Chitinophagaceae bacterium]|nr:hypothetical protein [Chitinophagaceae bacterium]